MNTHLPIPEHWSTEQVVAVLDLLEALYHTIRDTYDEELREIINAQIPLPLDPGDAPDPPDPDFDDDIPF